MAENNKNNEINNKAVNEVKQNTKSSPSKNTNIKKITTKKPSNLKNYFIDMLWIFGSFLTIAISALIYFNKIPKNIIFGLQSYFSYFYILALIGIFGVLGEQYTITFLGFLLPTSLAATTLLIMYKPSQFPINVWWNQYATMVLFSAAFLLYLYFRYEYLRKNGRQITTDSTGKVVKSDGALKARVDSTFAANYINEVEEKKKQNNLELDKALGISNADNKTENDAVNQSKEDTSGDNTNEQNQNETDEERMDREIRTMREEINKKSMRLTTTLMRIKNLTKSLDRDQIFANTVEIITKGLDAKKVQLLLNDEKEGKLRIVKATGIKPADYKKFEIPYEENSMITHLLKQKINDVVGGAGAFGVKECEVDPKLRVLIGKGVFKTILAAPIYADGKLFAILNVEEMTNSDYSRDDQNLLTTCAEVAGLVMKNAKLYSATMEDLVSSQKLNEEQLRKNEELRGSLSRIVSPSVAEMIMSDPSALKLGGKKCEVTMFFSDIRGFTKMSESMDPTDIVEQLNVYFTKMTDILMELDGTLDKYVGDELMALFGAPVARNDDPIRAVLCGVRMLEALYQLQEVWKKEGKPVIQIGIGVNTGIVTAGYMGSEKALSYTVIGDNVNLAARIMAQAKGMEMFITRATYERVKDYFDIEQRESIMVKGKSMPIEIFCVKKVKDGVDMSTVIGKDVAHLATSLVEEKPKSIKIEEPKPLTNLPPNMKKEDMKQNIQIEKVKMIACSNCGQENNPQEKFCTKCGMPIF